MNDAHEKLLSGCLFKEEDSFFYVYDFGDSYIFSIRVLQINKSANKSSSRNRKSTTSNVTNFDTNDTILDDIIDSLQDLLIDELSSSRKSGRKTKIQTSFELDTVTNNKKLKTKVRKKSSSKSTKRKANSQRGIYNDKKIEELLSSVATSFPDACIKEMITFNSDEFSLRLIKSLNFQMTNYSTDFFLKCYFSSQTSFTQLCSLFLNQIQLNELYCDNIFTSFLEFSSCLYIKNKTDYHALFKNLLVVCLFLCLDIFDSTSIKTFLSYSEKVLSMENLLTIANFWNIHNTFNKTQNLISFYLNSLNNENSKSNSNNGYSFFTKVLIYSKVSQKTLLYQLFLVFPEIISPLVNFILNSKMENNFHLRDWIIPIIELLGEHSDLADYNDLVEPMLLQTKFVDANGKLTFASTCWLITNNLSFVHNFKNQSSSRGETKIKRILNNPELFRRKIIDRRINFWLRIEDMAPSISSNKENNQYLDKPESIYVFQVNFRSTEISRTIALRGNATLHDLHLFIQDVFDFDNDHLYGFFLDNKPYSHNDAYFSPADDQGVSASEKEIFTCNFFIGIQFLYIFDFGDDLRFKLKVEKIRGKLDTENEFPYLLSQKGKSPKQYPDYY
jgi:hypothetical protein